MLICEEEAIPEHSMKSPQGRKQSQTSNVIYRGDRQRIQKFSLTIIMLAALLSPRSSTINFFLKALGLYNFVRGFITGAKKRFQNKLHSSADQNTV